MVGLVIVSHSRALADAVVGLLRQVSAVDLPVAVAAGKKAEQLHLSPSGSGVAV